MFVTDDCIVYSASDLAAAARCEYALLRDFDAAGLVPLSSATTRYWCEQLGSAPSMSGAGWTDCASSTATVSWSSVARRTPGGLDGRRRGTQQAIADGAPVVYQAAMFDGRFVGFADFLVRDGARYRVTDTKLARSAKVTALLQLAAYADALAAADVPVADEAELELGDGTVMRYRVDDLIPVYRSQRVLLQRLLDEHYASGAAVRWDDEHVQACFHCPLCTEQLRAADDLLLVAGLRVQQRDKLIEAGITTIGALAEFRGSDPDLPSGTLVKLTAQARLQVRQRQTGTPQFEIANPSRWPCYRSRTPATCSSTSKATRCGPPTGNTGGWNTYSACSGGAGRTLPPTVGA